MKTACTNNEINFQLLFSLVGYALYTWRRKGEIQKCTLWYDKYDSFTPQLQHPTGRGFVLFGFVDPVKHRILC